MTGTGGLQRVPRDVVRHFQIPLPPLEMPKQIVAEIAGYQKVIDGARAVVERFEKKIQDVIRRAWLERENVDSPGGKGG